MPFSITKWYHWFWKSHPSSSKPKITRATVNVLLFQCKPQESSGPKRVTLFKRPQNITACSQKFGILFSVSWGKQHLLSNIKFLYYKFLTYSMWSLRLTRQMQEILHISFTNEIKLLSSIFWKGKNKCWVWNTSLCHQKQDNLKNQGFKVDSSSYWPLTKQSPLKGQWKNIIQIVNLFY